ncbi:methyl-accepting chemotaxis protein [Thermanaerovibrio acidaminovorans]|uniref:methyl-accepting chemotaxis protein n=1 Tax=Thermanaerovibrio acidaminovorans TaxID=81462 RepID=UPI002491F1C3|nr:methyl-accepting chemotaxis protein [Thermanaerovibrio acidaminovorans]
MTMRQRLYAILLMAVLALGGMGFLAYYNGRRILEAHIMSGGELAAESAAASVRNWLDGRTDIVLTAAMNSQYLWLNYGMAGQLLQPYMEGLTKEYSNKGFMDIYIGLETGRFVDGSGWTPPDGWDPKTRPWYQEAVKKDGPTMTMPYVDANTGKMIVTIATPLKGYGDRLLGVLGADMAIDTLIQMVSSQRIMGHGYGILLAPDGTFVAHPKKDLVLKENIAKESRFVDKELSKIGQDILSGKYGLYRYRSVDGDVRLIFTRPLNLGWALALVVSEKEIFSPLSGLAMKQLLMALVAMALLAVLVLSVIRGLMRPIQCLMSVSGEAAKGDLSVSACFAGNDEMSQLGRALDTVISSQREIFRRFKGESDRILQQARVLEDVSDRTVETLVDMREQAEVLVRMATDNSEAVEAANAGIEEVASASQGAAQAASDASSYAESLKSNAEGARDLIVKTSDRVMEMASSFRGVADAVVKLNDQASQIGSIVNTISQIADQTNLLALNAAIEAARAGEAGKGFAVVAEEVRKLAEESNQAAKSIGELAGAIISGTSYAVKTATSGVSVAQAAEEETRAMREQIDGVLNAIGEIVSQIQNVAATAQEQSASAQEMAASIDRLAVGIGSLKDVAARISQVVDQISRNSDLLKASSDDLYRFSEEFTRAIQGFKIDSDGPLALKG